MTAPASLAHPVLRTHDLVWPQHPDCVISATALPAWAGEALAARVPVVVRRAPRIGGVVGVGLRGAQRHQRQALNLAPHHITRVLSPEALLCRPPVAGRGLLPALVALHQLRDRLPQTLQWGPTGSVGFELATGQAVVSAASDLDIVLRAPGYMSIAEARQLLSLTTGLGCRCDVQLETPAGGVALVEWARGIARVLVKTDEGPLLVANPWSVCEEIV